MPRALCGIDGERMGILITGGAGYIGSHTVLTLLEAGRDVIVIDNLSNSSYESLERVSAYTGKEIVFYKGDVRDENLLNEIFKLHDISSVIHFAALKSVSESTSKPLEYYKNNISGTLTLLSAMNTFKIKNLVFSSSATVYGNGKPPVKENDPIGGTTNPYGTSKFITELMLEDVAKADKNLNILALRYFNPVGAHPTGMIGEDPNGIPNNLVPFISQVAVGKLDCLTIFGNDYDTVDGTGVRDYIHVLDLAIGHLKSIEYLENNQCNFKSINLGGGQGYSVLEVVKTFEEISGKKIKVKIEARREGDIAESWAAVDTAKKTLNWEAKYSLSEMLKDTWTWQTKNPNGY